MDDPPTATAAPRASRFGRAALGLSLVLIALNLRALFPSLSALLPEVMAGTGASPALASVITTLPVLCLGVFSSAAAPAARRLGTERAVLAALAAVAAGTAMRGLATVPALLAGGVLAGAGIAFGNVLLPGLVKRDFPDRIATMTGLYSMSLSAGAAAAAALTVPVARASGAWSAGLAVWALPAAAVTALWLPRAARRRAATGVAVRSGDRPLYRSGLAWQVSLFMGLQSALAYCVFGWFAPMMRARGLEATEAGLLLSISVLAQVVGCFAAPVLAARGRDQRAAVLGCYALTGAGLFGCIAAPLASDWLWAALLGLGQGGLLGVALTVILLRAPDAGVAARLSGMAQGIGYTLAAGGPLLVGVIRQAAGGFGPVPVLYGALLLAGAASGLAAGRARVIDLG
ncbi:MFS transporter [Lichenibacterium dinghuense]|uniref:MFS transporter n=1 Tax=Lichenibacterium dinghuense TaxID=2895977 RepID=UPI001EFFE835|nr:MFS transporter [Lichenibacterium sp. 6Y81]